MEIKLYQMGDNVLDELKKNESFLIRTDIDYATMISKSEIEEIDSIFSPEYGIKDSHSLEIQQRLYSCQQGCTVGSQNLGKICPKCNTPIVKRKFPTSKLGYFKLPDIKVSTLVLLEWLEKLLGKKNFNNLIGGTLPGVTDLYECYEYMINTYSRKRTDPKYKKMMDFLLVNKEYFFTEYIPVISYKIRYLSKQDNMGVNNITTHPINTPLIGMSNIIQLLKEPSTKASTSMRKKLYFDLHKEIFNYKEALKAYFCGDKKKTLRDAIYGTRMPYTSWAVLAPLTDYACVDSCTIPIESFRCTFVIEIKEKLKEMGYPVSYINKVCSVQYSLDDNEKALMKLIFNSLKDRYIYINRQPTLGKGSILILEIREIRDEHVLRLHPNLLTWLNGDHDGDALVILGLAKSIRAKLHQFMSPNAYSIMYDLTPDPQLALKNDYQIMLTIGTLTEEE